jgi:hypothetical protein
MIFHKIVDFGQAHAFFSSYLLFLIGLSYSICRSNYLLNKILIAVFGIIFSAYTNTHTAFAAAPVIIFWVATFTRYRSFRGIHLWLSLVCLATVIGLIDGFTDANATWRFMYWASIIEDSWHRSLMLFGKGFGVQLMPEGSEYFPLLIQQVSGESNRDYQLMAVPPHNGLLSILVYLGLIGLIAFLYPYFKAIKVLFFNRRLDDNFIMVFSTSIGMLALLTTNQFIEVPYTAVIFWLVFGVMLTEIRTHQCTKTKP